jgi:1-acyl-sn-glycerol-3-phosphate acyltransferase
VAAKDYWDHGMIRKRIAMKELNVVLIERHRGEVRIDPLAPLKEALKAGDSLIIFPEGTRRPQPLPSEFKSGLWRLMREFPDVELIPVYIENLHRAMPKGVVIPVPTICSVRFGAPLPHSDNDPKEDFLTRARQAVVDLAQLS